MSYMVGLIKFNLIQGVNCKVEAYLPFQKAMKDKIS